MRDLRKSLPRRNRPIDTRSQPPTSITLHYNGTVVRNRSLEGELAQTVSNAHWHMKPYILSPDGGDGLQYHLVVFSDGSIAQTRDLEDTLWHCRHEEGNNMSIAVQLPLGGNQDATPAQWEATTRLFDELIARFGMAGRRRVLGHEEWSDSHCPGPRLMFRLMQWRDSEQFPAPRLYRVLYENANVRQGPGRIYPAALQMQPGEIFAAGHEVRGENIGGNDRWLHRTDELGFVHTSIVELVDADKSWQPPPSADGPEQSLRYLVLFDELHVRAEPSVDAVVVTTLRQGETLVANGLVSGETLGDSANWVALADPQGFVHEHLLRPLEQG
nr:peptidoglycan recognition family protein [Candidatus Chloroploca mongolica]